MLFLPATKIVKAPSEEDSIPITLSSASGPGKARKPGCLCLQPPPGREIEGQAGVRRTAPLGPEHSAHPAVLGRRP